MALAKKNRLNLRLHRKRVEANSKKYHSPFFTYLISSRPKSSLPSRFAILLSKKLARRAVDRNKIKRQVSQGIQSSLLTLPKNHDIILIPKKEIISKTIPQIIKDLKHVLSI